MSSGGSGYYKHPCIYKYSYNCPNWVWQNGDACGDCQAKGRPSQRTARESGIPMIEVAVPFADRERAHHLQRPWKHLHHILDPALSETVEPLDSIKAMRAGGSHAPPFA
ncbi:hypothetical protein K402DRAFT_400161 [Aulographum hederae CBS 113979]|uniref:Uncharacterized protein n=1 Tax=Aulographum hederae CBS 113979 TaxID=1176131 RepID=A0A6G1HEH5_9PEZI|nr:hypothetical protein K402DRAFT_400161 [Aulographum hederae CBS 113979]